MPKYSPQNVVQLKREIERLSNELLDVRQTGNRIKSELDSQIELKQKELERLNDRVEHHSVEVGKKFSELTKKRTSLEKTLASLQKDIADVDSELKKKKLRVVDLRRTSFQLENRREQFKKELGILQGTIKGFEEKKKVSVFEVGEVQNRKKNEAEALVVLQKDISKKKSELNLLIEGIKRGNEKNAKLGQVYLQLEKKVRTLKEKLQ